MTVWMLAIFYAVCFLPIVVIFAILPYIGRRTLSFGVSIPSGEFNDGELVRLRKKFAAGVVAYGALFTAAYAILLLFVSTGAAVYCMSAILLIYLVLVYAMYVKMWRRVKAIKENRGWQAAHEVMVADTRFQKKRNAVSPAWFIGFAVIILATVLIGLLLYDSMPDRIVQKYDFQGNAVQTAPKSVGLIFFAPAVQAAMAVIFAFVYWMLLRTPPVLDPDNPEATSRQNAVFRYRWSAYIMFGGMIMLLVFLVMQLGFTQVAGLDIQLWTPVIGAGALIIGAVALGVTTGQSGSRVKAGKKAEGRVVRRDDDRYWKWGVIYVNKDDPALFVEKRFGIGFTINFGRPAAALIIVGLILLVAAASIIPALLIE
jgi:uncharacterized membrane protein